MHDKILEYSNIILDHLLEHKQRVPSFTFSLRKRDSPQAKGEKRLQRGQWFQGSDYIYVPLFKKGDNARKIKTIGFVINFNDDDSVSNYIEISFKSDTFVLEEIAFHQALAKAINLDLNTSNHGGKHFDNPSNILENLDYYITEFRDKAIELLVKHGVKDKYLITEQDFQNDLNRVLSIRSTLNSSAQYDAPKSNFSIMTHPLNQILYGPPGTGKTYNSINTALEIIDDEDTRAIASNGRYAVKALFDKKVKEGQIVFTTFHQSMSYEDFIEGIKPEVEENEDGIRTVVYDIKDGLLKSVSKRAISEYYKFREKRNEAAPLDRLSVFEDAWNYLVELIQSRIDTNKSMVLETLTEKKIDVLSITNQGNLMLKPQVEGALEYTVSFTRTKKLFDAFPNLNVIKNIDKEFRTVIGGSNSTAYWSVVNFLNTWVDKHGKMVLQKEQPTTAIDEKLITFDQEVVKKHINEPVKRYVLIIDEINRGNVSAIFGELITLIEDSKRAGRDEGLEVTLPYSKQKFSVPPNLYIIGTMNTADRSVEALDTALRRRFAFKEMMPQPDLIRTSGALKETDGALIVDEQYIIDLTAVLEIINKRIKMLLDVDHQIGHSYLINVKSLKDLVHAFNNCIIPLLKEYFYHDEEKIALVLGEGFIGAQEEEIAAEDLFPRLSFANKPPIVRASYYFKPIDANNIVDAVLQLTTSHA